MTPFHALAFVLAAAFSPPTAPSALPTPQTIPPIAPSTVHGRLLIITPAYLVFTTGDAVRIGSVARIAPMLHLGQSIRVRFDPASHYVRSVEPAFGAAPQNEIDAAQLPRAYVTASRASSRSSANAATSAQSKTVSVGFIVHVPDDTPISDDVYLTTERSNFSPAELKMNRIDVRRWSASLPLVEGTTLHYQYTRGNYSTVERDSGGGVITPHALEVHEGVRTDDTVARWADTS
jgi:hypothetical protein